MSNLRLEREFGLRHEFPVAIGSEIERPLPRLQLVGNIFATACVLEEPEKGAKRLKLQPLRRLYPAFIPVQEKKVGYCPVRAGNHNPTPEFLYWQARGYNAHPPFSAGNHARSDPPF